MRTIPTDIRRHVISAVNHPNSFETCAAWSEESPGAHESVPGHQIKGAQSRSPPARLAGMACASCSAPRMSLHHSRDLERKQKQTEMTLTCTCIITNPQHQNVPQQTKSSTANHTRLSHAPELIHPYISTSIHPCMHACMQISLHRLPRCIHIKELMCIHARIKLTVISISMYAVGFSSAQYVV